MKNAIQYTQLFLPKSFYPILFSLLGLVYIIGLFVPLMDNDAAHHANIALHMFLTGDYINLVSSGNYYLDKPHLHFWLCVLSYKIFGVTGFAYKLPSFLFTIFGTYCTYRLGKILYNKETGKLAALVLASAFGYMLANSDVRMDAILTACIAFTIWSLVEFVEYRKTLFLFCAALGLALGFSTKGHIATFTPVIALIFYLVYKQEWRLFFSTKWLIVLALFALLISPVVYSYFIQFNLHPHELVRGKYRVNGVQFILFNQSIERFNGGRGNASKNDFLFFFHSFIWAFAPWSILAYAALITKLKNFANRGEEWLTTCVLITIIILITLSSYKLPHYLNIVFPVAAVMTAVFIFSSIGKTRLIKTLFIMQLIFSAILIIISLILNLWAFPITKVWIIISTMLLLAFFFFILFNRNYSLVQKMISSSVVAILFTFFLLNANFYPQLLHYQGGNQLAFTTKGIVDPANVYFWKQNHSSSYNFYTASLRKPFTEKVLQSGNSHWLLFDIKDENDIKEAGIKLGERFTVPDFEITRLNFKFINPNTRLQNCTHLVLAKIKS